MAIGTPASLDPLLLRKWAANLHGPVIFPDDIAYDSARLVWNRAVDLHPAVIVRAADVDDVRSALELARERGLPLAVRSGGHSQAGHGTCDGGVVLDLGGFRGVAIDGGRRIARVAAGSRVADVFDAMHAHHVFTPMGGCPDVGIGGLTLGGGENFLMAKFGAVVDNVVAAEVVTVDGRVLTAGADEHADLFWAIRGGSGNFGIATAFEYTLHSLDDVLFGQLTFPIERARDAMLRYRDLMADAPDELQTSGGLSPMPGGGSAFFITLCFCGDRAAGDSVRRRWLSALRPASEGLKWMPYSADLAVPAAASVGTGLFLSDLADEAIDIYADGIRDAPPAAAAVWNDFHGAVTRVPADATAFPLRERGFDLFFSVPFETPEHRAAAARWTTQVAGRLRPFSRGVYVNNLNDAERDRVREAYGRHYDRLAAIKAKYDPGNVLRVNHNIPPE